MTVALSEAVHETRDDLVRVTGTDWAFWSWACLRSAGFPADCILKLAAPEPMISSVDEVIESTNDLRRAKGEAFQEIERALDILQSLGQWANRPVRKTLLSAKNEIAAERVPESLPEILNRNVIRTFEVAIHRAHAARVCFDEQFAASMEQGTETIREIAADPAFQEAVTWQNRAAIQRVLNPLLRLPRDGSMRNSHHKQREELVASYWQRYCVKNDTIGFFGPVGWARFSTDVPSLAVRPGEHLLSSRKTYWEAWAIEVLGALIVRKYKIQPWIAPIPMPFNRLGATVLHHPVFGPIRITAREAAVLRACNGSDSAIQIAKTLVKLPKQFRTEAEVYETLEQLAEKGFVAWKMNVPVGPHPERVLREALEQIEDPRVRQFTLGLLEELDSAKISIAEAAGDTERLNVAFDNLEQAFTRITDVPATRAPGMTYAGRTLVYEDCCRNVEVKFGAKLLESLAKPLTLFLIAGRWLTARIADLYRSKLFDIHSELVQTTGKTAIDAARLLAVATPLFTEDAAKITASIHEEFQSKWEYILKAGQGDAPIFYSSDELHHLVLKEFPSVRPGWKCARYHSPDIMIAADDEQAISRGDYFFVMGELHVSKNTLDAALFVNQHPSPEDLFNAVERDLGKFNIVPVGFKAEEIGCRTVPSLIGSSDLHLEYLPDCFTPDRSKALPVSSLVIENCKGELLASTRDKKFSWNVIDLVGRLLSAQVIDSFRIIASRPHTPRIWVDRLVVTRESWRFCASDLKFVHLPDPAERFLQARRWAKEHRIPRFLFYKVPVERKPAYLDLESPVLVDIFAKMVRRTIDTALSGTYINISEMLPGMNQMWLSDAHRRRYTSEFRLVAVDMA